MSKRVLLVDDESDMLELLKDRLEGNGYTVLTANDGCCGLDKAKAENPDLIILDLLLPSLDGWRVCQALKMDKAYQHIPIIMLSGIVDNDAAAKTGNEQADAFLPKPFKPEVLLGKIDELLKN